MNNRSVAKFYIDIAGYVLILFLGLVFLWPMFNSGYLVRGDSPSHHFEHNFLVNHLIPVHGWINGWCMQDFLGYPILLYRSQFPLWLIVILNKLFLVPLVAGYKIMVLLSLIILCCGMYFLIAQRFGKKAAICVSLILMLQKDIYFDKILAGMWENYFAIGILLIFFSLLYNSANSLSLKRTVFLGVLLAIIILSHVFATIVAFFLIFVIFLVNRMDNAGPRQKWLRQFYFLVIPLIGLGISFFYIYSLLKTNWYLRPMSNPKPLLVGLSWAFKGFVGGFEHFFTLGQRGYSHFFKGLLQTFFINYPLLIRDLFGIWGIIIFWKNRFGDYPNKRFLVATGVLIVFALLIFSDILFIFPFWKGLPFASNLLPNRFLVYAHIGLLIFAAHGILKVFAKDDIKRIIPFAFIIVLFAGSFLAHKHIYVSQGAKVFDELPDARHLKELWEWVAKNVDPINSRIVYENTVGNSEDPRLRESTIFALAGLYTRVPQIGGLMAASPYPTEAFTRTDTKSIFGKGLLLIDDTEIIKRMREDFNSQFIVSSEPLLREKLLKSDFFINEKNFGPFSIFRLKGFESNWVDFKKKYTTVNWVRLEDQLLELDIRNQSLDNWARIKVAFHPYWKAT
jgi:hypothetical protein